jgi:Asp-tRNA(Asn)/Glu-tRNA(Gln) amidotransferase A subunit family amidase
MVDRRTLLKSITLLGISSPVFARALAQQAENQPELTRQMIADAQWISGVELDEAQQNELLGKLNQNQSQLKRLREFQLDPQADIPALSFGTLTTESVPVIEDEPTELPRNSWPVEIPDTNRPTVDEELAWLPVTALAPLLRSRKVSSVELTKLYLERLKKYDPTLVCVVNLTEALALKQAEQADREISSGQYRGPLHGIPWGAKDLISYPGYPTAWGIPVFKDRVINETATVAQRLTEAGAVLVAKLSLGAIAMGDQWYRGKTRNPWNPRTGSSGSSAGSASATAAGLVGFALGSETLGSILSPSNQCGVYGLRPTFGRVSRAGCMPLSWSMDKIGPLARNVDDLGTILAAIYGPDQKDPTVVRRAFSWPPRKSLSLKALRVGVIKGASESDETVDYVRQLGCRIKEVELPQNYPLSAMTSIIDIEGATVFNELLREGKTEGWNTWTESFQSAQFVTAIDYLRMQRVRRRLMLEFEESIREIDVLWNARDLMITNFTGHPSVTMPYKRQPIGRGKFSQPKNLVITGHLFDEQTILQLAHAVETRLGVRIGNPPLNFDAMSFEKKTSQPS